MCIRHKSIGNNRQANFQKFVRDRRFRPTVFGGADHCYGIFPAHSKMDLNRRGKASIYEGNGLAVIPLI